MNEQEQRLKDGESAIAALQVCSLSTAYSYSKCLQQLSLHISPVRITDSWLAFVFTLSRSYSLANVHPVT